MTDANTDAFTRRNPLLVASVFFANLYLFSFGLDAAISTLDEMLRSLIGVTSLGDLRNIVAIVVFLASPLMLLLLIFVPHLPKRIFLPLVIFALWAGIGAPPFTFAPEARLMNFLTVVLQLALFVAAVSGVLRQTGRRYLQAADLPTKTHLLRRTLIALGVTTVAFAILLPVIGALLLTVTLEKQTGGYIHFTAKGIDVMQAEFARSDKTVRLVGMIHIGEAKFYRDLFASFPPGAVVLAEGVSDREGRLSGKFSYNRVAKVLGLEEQSGIQAAWMKAEAEKSATSDSAPQVADAVMHADIDVSEFSDVTIRFLTEIGEIYSSDSIWQAFRRIGAMNDHYTEQDVNTVYADIIDKRNARLIASLDQALATHNTIIIPWGAEHMPTLEKALIDRGFSIRERETRNAIEYRSLF